MPFSIHAAAVALRDIDTDYERRTQKERDSNMLAERKRENLP